MTAAAVLFDMDGLLVDSEPVWYSVEEAAVLRLGGTWAPEHQAALAGGTIDASCRYMIELTGADMDADDLAAELLAEMVLRFRVELPVHEGALELVDAVRSAGVATGLVSSSYRVLVDAALERLDRDRFDVTVAGDEISRGKPDPEPFRTACDRLGVEASAVVVLEDALHGVTSAEAAGCVVVAVPSVAPIEATSRRPVVRRLADIDVEWLLSLPEALA
ncbi:MAG TPA: HAD family phosphatase [Mycobacteriales bacterium]|nr:HAD family phosphatase [Mycobacteriales bacterium]